MTIATDKFIDIDKAIRTKAPKLYRFVPKSLIKYLHRKTHVDELNHILDIFEDRDGVDFMTSVVDYFNLTLNVKNLEKIATDDRYVFVSNHPLGGLDGICLSAIIGERFDKRIKYFVNDLLYQNIPNLRSIFIPINKHGGQNRELVRETQKAYESDNQIITFPAGLCSRLQNGKIIDLDWQKSFVQKAIETKRTVVPIHFEARNSDFFYKFANRRKRLGIKFNIEMLYLPDEMMKNKNSTFTITFGEPIDYSFFDKSKTHSKWADYVKDIVYELGENKE